MKKYILWCGLLVYSFVIKAQSDAYNPIGTSGVSVQLGTTPNKNIYPLSSQSDSAEGNFGYKNLDLSANFVLYKKVTAEGGFKLLNLSPFYSYQRMQLGWLLNPQHIIRTGVRATGFYAKNPKHIWMIQGGAFASNDDYTIYKPTIRYHFSGIYHHKSSEKYAWSAGLLFNYNFGRAWWIPFFQTDFSVGQGKRLRIGFPSGIQYAYYRKTGQFWTIKLSPRGQVATLTNQFGEFATHAPTVQLRYREWVLAWKYYHHAGTQGRWFIETALCGGRKLYVSDGIGISLNNFQTGAVKRTLSLCAGYTFHFSPKKKSNPPISEEDLDNLIY